MRKRERERAYELKAPTVSGRYGNRDCGVFGSGLDRAMQRPIVGMMWELARLARKNDRRIMATEHERE